MLGALLTVATMVLVGILFVSKLTEVINMRDPTIQVYSQPITKKEVESLSEINFDQNHFNIGVQFWYPAYDES